MTKGHTKKGKEFLSRLCGGEGSLTENTIEISFLSRLCGGEGKRSAWITLL